MKFDWGCTEKMKTCILDYREKKHASWHANVIMVTTVTTQHTCMTCP